MRGKFKSIKDNFSGGLRLKVTLTVAMGLALVSIGAIGMRRTVELEINGEKQSFKTYKKTVQDVLLSKGIEIKEKDKVEPSLESEVGKNGSIKIKTAVPVKLAFKDKNIEILSAEETVKDVLASENEALRAEGIEYKEKEDEVNPGIETKITPNLDIKIVDVEVKTVKEEKSIPYETVTKKDSSIEKNKKVVKREGLKGTQELTFEVVFKDGKEISREKVKSKTIKAPTNALIMQGTKAPVKYIPSRGASASGIKYKRKLVVEATAYSGDGITATGTVPVYNPGGVGTIAVDPRVIPLGSLVYVEGYGYARAADTGGVIKGNIIDVFLGSNADCIRWGRKYNVNVYIIE